ncbi:MAG: serine O-acetyltransferase EpsC [Alphaproteobacteria bacterium]
MGIFAKLGSVITATVEKDPAARSRLEVVLAYPGFHAMVFYYMAHALCGWRLKLLGRWVSAIGRSLTGIEIHPSARIGQGLFIDHGSGVVIGGTTEIGANVTLYQGVTLGGTSLDPGKRHPTIDDDVIIGAGAKVLGPITIGKGARIGANAVVVKDVAPHVTMVGVLARPTTQKQFESDRFVSYGVPTEGLPDPVARSMEGLLEHIHRLSVRIEDLEEELKSRDCLPDSSEADSPEFRPPRG